VSGEHPRGGEYDCATSLRKLGLVEIVLHPRALARLTAAGRAWCVAHLTPNSESYYVWPLRTDGTPLESEGPYGPHDLEGAKTYARIAATEGKHDRAVSRGIDPTTPSFEIVRRYKAGTGNRVI
jgi:hypothetical protein